MTYRLIGHDQHFGRLGLGAMTLSAADAFSSAPISQLIEPDIVIKSSQGRTRVLEIDIDDILVWDNREWTPRMNFVADLTATQNTGVEIFAGITVDNTQAQTAGPTADSIAQGTFPGGPGAAVTGAATATNTVATVGREVPPFVEGWDFGMFSTEENATGEINNSNLSQFPKQDTKKMPYQVDGNTAHQLLTGAHYWMWADTNDIAAAPTLNLSADVRRTSIDIEELMFDRAVLFSILDALVLTN